MSIGSIAGIIVSNYLLPINDLTLKSTVGLLIGNATERIITNCYKNLNLKWIKRIIISDEYTVLITNTNNNDNILYEKVEKYIIMKYLDNISKCPIETKNGEITFVLKDIETRNGILYDKFQEHLIKLTFYTNTPDNNGNNNQNNIVLSSKTAKIDTIKDYIEYICNNKESSQCINIYKAVVQNTNNKKEESSWNLIYTLSNKKRYNTILNEKNDKELYQDIDWFMNNLNYYNKRGIPYKRGYLLYGPPGTGKTSVIKAIANDYNLDIFSIQMDGINDSNLTILLSKVNEICYNKPHILVLEDFDRSYLFDRFSHRTFGNLLNEIDGVTEPYGRILFITANDCSKFKSKPELEESLFRPGRIDKKIELTYCTKNQAIKIIKLLTDINLTIKTDNINNITPAELMNIIQSKTTLNDESELEELLIQRLEKTQHNISININEGIIQRQSRITNDINNKIKRKRSEISNAKRQIKDISNKYQKLDKIQTRQQKLETQLKNLLNRKKKSIDKQKSKQI